MPTPDRPNRLGVRLSQEELWLCQELARRHGIDASGVARGGILRWAREEGLVYPGPDPQAAPKTRKARKPR